MNKSYIDGIIGFNFVEQIISEFISVNDLPHLFNTNGCLEVGGIDYSYKLTIKRDSNSEVGEDNAN